MAFNPNLQTSLRSELAQGANVGDIREGYRWDGVSWSKEGGGSSYSSGNSSGINMDDIINQSIKRYQEANQPAVQSLEAGIPETQTKYSQLRTQQQGRIDPLKERYTNLINEVKNYGLVKEQRQTQNTQAEMARRGILNSSGLAQQELTNALQPITSETSYKVQDLGYQQEDAIKEIENYIANLTPQETEELRLARNAIAQLQSGAANSGISTGIDVYKQKIAEQQQAETTRLEQERQKRQTELLSSLFATNESGSSATTNTMQSPSQEEYRQASGMTQATPATKSYSTGSSALNKTLAANSVFTPKTTTTKKANTASSRLNSILNINKLLGL